MPHLATAAAAAACPAAAAAAASAASASARRARAGAPAAATSRSAGAQAGCAICSGVVPNLLRPSCAACAQPGGDSRSTGRGAGLAAAVLWAAAPLRGVHAPRRGDSRSVQTFMHSQHISIMHCAPTL